LTRVVEKNVDSDDHLSHVAFLSTGPDNGTCADPRYPVTLPRIFLEVNLRFLVRKFVPDTTQVYWYTQTFDDRRNEALTPRQPFV